ncbi:MAG: hypothetical protein Kow00124_00770 [Anaerolineae bacterium]
MDHQNPLFIILMVVLLATLACNLPLGGGEEITPTAPAAADKPVVTIAAPPSGAEVQVGQEVAVQSTTTDTLGVVGIELQANGTRVRIDTTPDSTPQLSFSLLQSWVPAVVGDYTLSVIAYRADGTASDPASIVVKVTEAEESEAAAPSTTGTCMARPNTDLNVRSGPGTTYSILGVLALGSEREVTGRDEGAFWWQIAYPAGPGGRGWVSAPYTTLSGDCTAIPVAAYAPPPATAAPTATPTSEATAEPSAPTNTPTPPDLVVSAITMPGTILLPLAPPTEATVTIQVTVQNVGGTAATGFNTVLRPEGTFPLSPSLNLGLIASLGPGESFTYTVDYTYSSVGSFTVEAVVDAGDAVDESDEGNNVRTLGIQVSQITLAITPLVPIQPIQPLPILPIVTP